MLRWRGLAEDAPDWNRTVVTIGVFDGVHRGHRALIDATVREAARLLPVPRPVRWPRTSGGRPEWGPPVVVVTFDPHPAAVLHPAAAPTSSPRSTTGRCCIETLAATGSPSTASARCRSRRRWPSGAGRVRPHVIVEHLRAAAVVVGESFRFGHRAKGTSRCSGRSVPNRLRSPHRAAARHRDGPVSSTRIRADVDRRRRRARRRRARPSAPGRGHRRPRRPARSRTRLPDGEPVVATFTAVPDDGVYAGWLMRDPARRGGSGSPAAGRDQRRYQPDLRR